ncbi:MAG: hypothetical protein E7672_02870 [Ruminococcaceae bacterium]|nr:hypothetical protein [Oscillospiraceae bacterium]
MESYFVYPSVVQAGKHSTIRVVPRSEHGRLDNKFMFYPLDEVQMIKRFPDEWFDHNKDLTVKVLINNLYSSYVPQNESECYTTTVPVDSDGGITIDYLFDREQEYLIKVSNPHNHNSWRYVFSVYAVGDDLFGKRAYKGDLHIHSIYSDAYQSLEINAANYRCAGFDFIAMTDHCKRFPSLMMMDLMDKHNLGLTAFAGEEVHVPNIVFHYVHLGGDYSVNEWYADHMEEYENEFNEIYKTIDLPEGRSKEYAARLKWIHEANKKAGGLSIFVHPHWVWRCQNLPDDVIDYVFENGFMDVFELFGGQKLPMNNTQLALWQEYAFKGKKYPIVASSDAHTSESRHEFDDYYTIAFADNCSFDCIKDAILKEEVVAVDNYESFRAHGSLRYVRYAQFLAKRYFPVYTALCNTVGMNMRLYYEGNPEALEAALISQRAADSFAEKFFGRA